MIADFCGHGIGAEFHMLPSIAHISSSRLAEEDVDRSLMKTGMIFTIEPLLSEGSHAVRILSDGWTAVSVDDSRSAQFEETILIKDDGAEILTAEWKNQKSVTVVTVVMIFYCKLEVRTVIIELFFRSHTVPLILFTWFVWSKLLSVEEKYCIIPLCWVTLVPPP